MSKKYDFDITVGANTYAGDPDGFYSAAVESALTIGSGAVDLMEGITYQTVLNTVNADSGVVQAAGCSFADGASVTLGEQVLTLTDLMVNEDICISTLVPLWQTYVRRASRNGIEAPEFVEYVMAHLAAKVGESIEGGIWKGTSPYGVGLLSNDGTLDEAGADASIFKDFTEYDLTDAIDAADVDDVFNGVLDAAMGINGGALCDAQGAGFYVNRKTYHLYSQYLRDSGNGQGHLNQSSNQDLRSGLVFDGYPVYKCPGMFDDTVAFTYPENIKVGTSAGADFNDLKLIDLRETTGDDKLRITGRFQIGAQVANPNDGVYATSVWT